MGVSGYRNDLEAAQHRIDVLESSVADREAEIARLETRSPRRRSPSRVVGGVVAGLAGLAILGGSLSQPAVADSAAAHLGAITVVIPPPVETVAPPTVPRLDSPVPFNTMDLDGLPETRRPAGPAAATCRNCTPHARRTWTLVGDRKVTEVTLFTTLGWLAITVHPAPSRALQPDPPKHYARLSAHDRTGAVIAMDHAEYLNDSRTLFLGVRVPGEPAITRVRIEVTDLEAELTVHRPDRR